MNFFKLIVLSWLIFNPSYAQQMGSYPQFDIMTIGQDFSPEAVEGFKSRFAKAVDELRQMGFEYLGHRPRINIYITPRKFVSDNPKYGNFYVDTGESYFIYNLAMVQGNFLIRHENRIYFPRSYFGYDDVSNVWQFLNQVERVEKIVKQISETKNVDRRSRIVFGIGALSSSLESCGGRNVLMLDENDKVVEVKGLGVPTKAGYQHSFKTVVDPNEVVFAFPACLPELELRGLVEKALIK